MKCAVFGCRQRFERWDAVEFAYCGELHFTCSYECLHSIKQAVTCRIQQRHRDLVQSIIKTKPKDIAKHKVWGDKLWPA